MFQAMKVMMLVSIAAACFAAETGTPPPAPAPQGVKFSGWSWITMGRFENSPVPLRDIYDANFQKEWISDFDAGFKIVAPMPYGWNSRFHLGMTTAYPVPYVQNQSNSELMRRKLVLYMIDAALEKKITVNNHSFYVEGGFFPVKYNPQSMNLGEYLFRSGTYPQTLYSGFELADKEKLVGIHLQYTTAWNTQGWIKGDFFFTSGFRDAPIHDFSPALILTASPDPAIEAGLGFDYEHLISVDERRTTPATDPENKRNIGTPVGNYYVWLDTNAATKGDTVIYTFRGLKSEARLTLNPQAYFTSKYLGKEDLKLYGEIALLGLQNYPGWYEKMWERVPIMFGFNFPSYQPLAFTAIPALLGGLLTQGSMGAKVGRAAAYGVGGAVIGVGLALLDNMLNIDTKPDVIAMEGEYFANKYWNSTENVWRNRSPVPFTGVTPPNYADRNTEVGWYEKTDDDWKWSVYMSKKLFKMIRISAQVASDHASRTQFLSGPPSNSKYTDLVPASYNWYWMTRIMYYF
jgi:hypothetical protein